MDKLKKTIAIITIGTFLFSLAPASSIWALRPPETTEQASGSAKGLGEDLKTTTGAVDMADEVLATAYQSALDGIARRGEMSFAEMHQIVVDAVPQEATNLRQALNHPTILGIVKAEKATIEEMQAVMDEASAGLREPGVEFLRLALYGPGQGGLDAKIKDWLRTGIWDVSRYVEQVARPTLERSLKDAEFFVALTPKEKETLVRNTAHLLVEEYKYVRKDLEYVVRSAANFSNTPEDFQQIIALANLLSEKGINPDLTLEHGIPRVAKNTDIPEEFQQAMALATRLAKKGVDPSRTLHDGIPVVKNISKTAKQFQIYLSRLGDLIELLHKMGRLNLLNETVIEKALTWVRYKLVFHPEEPVSLGRRKIEPDQAPYYDEDGEYIPAWIEVVPIKKSSEAGAGGAQITAMVGAAQPVVELTTAELAQIRDRLIEKLAPEIEQGGYALVLHPEPAGIDARIIRGRLLELGFDSDHIKIVATLQDAQQLIKELKDKIVVVVNRLDGVDIMALIAGLPVQDVSGKVASVVPDTAKYLEIWL